MDLHIGHLYPDLMNIYGDRGNVIALSQRAKWRGIDVAVAGGVEVEPADGAFVVDVQLTASCDSRPCVRPASRT